MRDCIRFRYTLLFILFRIKPVTPSKIAMRMKITVFIIIPSYQCFAWAFSAASMMLASVSILV